MTTPRHPTPSDDALKPALLEVLVDPLKHRPLTFQEEDSRLVAEDGEVYPVVAGIPRFVKTDDPDQVQTQGAFSYKWNRRQTFDWQLVRGDDAPQNAWLLEKYGFSSVADWTRAFSPASRVLDLGCGAGVASWPWLTSDAWTGSTMWVGADISDAIDVAARNLGHVPNTHFVQADALRLPFPEAAFDIILSEGVLHHTPSTKDAIASAARALRPGGAIYFYVYRQKGPIREFTDDHVRQAIAGMSDPEAWEAMGSLTELARRLSDLHVTVELPEDIPLLGIAAGKHDVQRLIYWNFAKLYWNDLLTFDENVHVNFDWYRPRYAHRQTEAEVREWCDLAGLRIRRFHTQESGFTVVAVRD
jgi:SAM-dependent methyltransferase